MFKIGKEVIKFVLLNENGFFKKIFLKIKLQKLKKNINSEIYSKIVSQHQKEVYYNKLDQFISNQKIISFMFSNIIQQNIFGEYSRSTFARCYSNAFLEKEKQFNSYRNSIELLFKDIYEITFSSVYELTTDKKTLMLTKWLKEFLQNVFQEMKEIKSSIAEIEHNHKKSQTNHEVKSNEVVYQMKIDEYKLYLLNLYQQQKNRKFDIKRTLYNLEPNKENGIALDLLIECKNILLLGDAGAGKSYESLVLIKNIIENKRTENMIPVYLALKEYGLTYNEIAVGILNKLLPFSKNLNLTIVKEMLLTGIFVIVLDGIDEIIDNSHLQKCYFDIQFCLDTYKSNYYFVSSRENRYNKNLIGINSYKLKGLDKYTIQKIISDNKIHTEIPDIYYELFKNPLMLKIGLNILDSSNKKCIYNQSMLFSEMIELYCLDWNNKKGLLANQAISAFELFEIIGKFTYDNRKENEWSYFQFESYFENKISKDINLVLVVSQIFSTGIFILDKKITFAHKLFQEYMIAHYLQKEYSFNKSNVDFYRELLVDETNKQIMIFLAGLVNEYSIQNDFLDFILEENFELYINCVKAKVDLGGALLKMEQKDFEFNYLSTLLNSYKKVISTYFKPISSLFDPKPNRNDFDIGIAGSYEKDGMLYYSFTAHNNKNAIQAADGDDINEFSRKHKKNVRAHFGYISEQFLYPGNNDKPVDSARIVALQHVKSELDKILKNGLLFEHYYMTSEQVLNKIKKIPELREIRSTEEIYNHVKSKIAMAQESSGSERIQGIHINGLEYIGLYKMVDYLMVNNINIFDNILPESDIRPSGKSHWIWDVFSKKQMILRVREFYKWHQIAYKYVVEKNFTHIRNSLETYKMIPYQTKIIYNHTNKKNDSGPNFTYYRLALNEKEIPSTIIISDIEDNRQYQKDIPTEIINSYKAVGKEIIAVSYTSTGVTHIINGRGNNDDTPITDEVYYSLKRDFDRLFNEI